MLTVGQAQHPLPWLTHTHILPAVGVRDGEDGLLSLVAAVAMMVMCVAGAALPAGIAYVFTGSAHAAWVGLYAGWMLVVATVVLTVVHWMRIDERGITLGRRVGRKFVAWEDVTEIRPATRREVVVDGWLWPPVPPREATRCLSSIGHYRIDHRGGHFYFPPADEHQFLGALEYWRSIHDHGRAVA
jgi:hypothetical protein